MLRFTYELEPYRNALEIKEFYPEKNPHECKIKKEYGNKAYQEGKDIDALHFYTQAVLSAPCDEETGKSKDLAIALANRSAVLFSLKAYHLSLDDIKLAFDSGYPEELHFKLLERKAKILYFFKQFIDARDTYKQLLKSLDVAKVDANKKLKIQKETQNAIKMFDKAPSVYNDPNVIMHVQTDLPKLPDKNKKYPALSNAVCFQYEPGRGRFAIAQRYIKVGEFICVDAPIVSHPLPEYLGSNCYHCFKSMKAPLPCPVCTKVMFCSYECRKIALSTYHKYECKIFDFLIASGMSIVCFLAYKAVVQKPLEFFLEHRDKFENHDESSGVQILLDEDGKPKEKYLSSDYRNYFNLVTHRAERKAGDVFHRAMLAVMLLRCMKKYGYFGPDTKDDVLTDDECYIGFVLNHFLEDNVCVQTIKNIKKGEEICENYGPIFFHSAKEDRQERLKAQYWFDCNCISCEDNWPLMHEMTDEVLNFKCSACGGSVPFVTTSNNVALKCACGTPVSLLKALKAIGETDAISEQAKQSMLKGHLTLAQELYSKYMTDLDSYLAPPYADYYKIQQYIWKCIWMRFGNRVIRGKLPQAPSNDFDSVD